MKTLPLPLLLLVLLLALAPPGTAQVVSSQQQATAVGAIRGEVYDSLLGVRLEGAHVSIQGTARRATTDRQGQFSLDSIPTGRHLLVLDHPSLDSVGLFDLPWVVEVADGRTTHSVLAVPSLRTMWVRACAASPTPIGADSGIVFGAVRDAERGVRLSGARVVATWVVVSRTRRQLQASRRGVEVVADSVGNYYVCGAPSAVGLTAQTIAGGFTSGVLQLEVGERRLLRQDLSVSREPPTAEQDTVEGRRRGRATIVGTVRGDRGGPVEGALVSVLGAEVGAVSDRNGRFVIGELPSGSQMLVVRRLGFGFSATPVELRNRDTARVALELSSITLLDTITVTATQWVRVEIDELRSRLRFGSPNRVRTAQDLAVIGTIHAALQEFPGLTIATRTERARRGGAGIALRRGGRECTPDVYVDGWKVDLEVLEQYRPNDLIALEVYPTLTAPMRYINPWSTCAVVLAWTRYLQ